VKQLLSVEFWSAAPTPLTSDLKVDVTAVERMVHAAIADGMTGLFLAGTCGEGPWLPNRERNRLVKVATQAAQGRLRIAAQVSDNSAPRILDNIFDIAEAGADFAILAPPFKFMNATPLRIAALFEEAARISPLPVGIYDLGAHSALSIPADRLKQVYLLPNVSFVKDSSADPARRAIALAARQEKPGLKLFNGDEFRCLEYLEAGYNGCMFGGAAVVAPMLHTIVELFLAGRVAEARQVEEQMKNTLYGIYGGESISCWLTGLKYCMVRKGVFASTSSYLDYPLTEDCREFIDRYTTETGEMGDKPPGSCSPTVSQ
jgi:4-hydroxy-tetrahydrodipicolinate synthase